MTWSRALEFMVTIVCSGPFIYLLLRLVKEKELQRHQYDGMRLGNSINADIVEVVDPPFWRINRLLKKRKAIGWTEFMVNDEMGKPRLKRLRIINVDNPHDCCPLCKRPFRGQ